MLVGAARAPRRAPRVALYTWPMVAYTTIQVRALKQMGIRVMGYTPDHGERSHGRAVRLTSPQQPATKQTI